MFILILILPIVLAVTEEEKAEARAKVEQLRDEITAECMDDPYSCSCQRIPCDDILKADHEDKDKYYKKCVDAKGDCENKRQNAIKEIEATKQKIESQCRKNLDSCDCSSIDNEDGKEECELAIINARYEAEKARDDKITECASNLDNCDCNSIENEDGRKECEKELKSALQLREKIKSACQDNPLNCDCSEIKQSEGKKECEEKKREGLNQASNQIKEMLSKCFKDVYACDCSQLGLPEESYVEFCEIQKNYGMNCRNKGSDCEKLDEVDIYPPGMPAWLGKLFASSYKEKIEEEKVKGAKEAASMITTCINSPEECACEKTPQYAQSFCNRMKELQIKCYAENYDACVELDNSPSLPEGMPAFTLGMVDKLVNKLRSAREGASKANAARKVGAMILECMDDSSMCDCSFAPKGNIKSFCEHKTEMVIECRDKKNYNSCFTLDEEALVNDDVPDFIKNYVQKNTLPKVENKKIIIFNEMKEGTDCAEAKTLADCKRLMGWKGK